MLESCRAAYCEIAVDVRSAVDQSVQVALLHASPEQVVADLMLMLEGCTGVPVQYQTLLLEKPGVGLFTLEGHERVDDALGAGGTLSFVRRAPQDAEAEWRDAWHLWPCADACANGCQVCEDGPARIEAPKRLIPCLLHSLDPVYGPSAALIRYLLQFVDPNISVDAYCNDPPMAREGLGCSYHYKGPAIGVALRHCSLEACVELMWDPRLDVNGVHAFSTDCGCSGNQFCSTREDLVELCMRFGRMDVCWWLVSSGLLSSKVARSAELECERMEEAIVQQCFDDSKECEEEREAPDISGRSKHVDLAPLASRASAENAEMLEEKVWITLRSRRSLQARRAQHVVDGAQRGLGRSAIASRSRKPMFAWQRRCTSCPGCAGVQMPFA